jgi:nicotinamidase-related amidase
MVQALIVIDVQNGLVEQGDFHSELSRMEKLIHIFKDRSLPVVFMRHEDEEEESPLYKGSRGAEIHPSLKEYADVVIEKNTPSFF